MNILVAPFAAEIRSFRDGMPGGAMGPCSLPALCVSCRAAVAA